MLRIPEKLKIGAHDYTVLYPYTFKERDDIIGQCCTQTQTIRIAGLLWTGEARSKSSLLVTLLHEILHAVDGLTGHGVFKNNEPAVEGFSESLAAVLIDNGFIDLGAED